MTINLTPRKCLAYRSPVEAFLSELGRDIEIRFARNVATRAGIHPVEISVEVKIDEASRRLKIVPGIDPITSSVIAAAPPDASNFTVAREMAAWLLLTTKLHSNGSTECPKKISRMGTWYIRRLLYTGCLSTIAVRHRKPAGDDWL